MVHFFCRNMRYQVQEMEFYMCVKFYMCVHVHYVHACMFTCTQVHAGACKSQQIASASLK